MSRVRRSMDSIMFFRDADPRCACGVSGAGREYGCRFLRVGVPKEVWVIVEPRIMDHTRDGPVTNRQRIVRAADRGGILRQFLAAGAVRDYSALGFLHHQA